MTKKTYDQAFKRQVVQMIQEEGKTVPQVAKELGLHTNTVYRWVSEIKQDGGQAFPGSGQLKDDDKAIKALQKQIRDLQEENDILKKRPCTTLQKTGTDLCLHPQIPLPVPCREAMCCYGCFQKRLLQMDKTQDKQAREKP